MLDEVGKAVRKKMIVTGLKARTNEGESTRSFHGASEALREEKRANASQRKEEGKTRREKKETHVEFALPLLHLFQPTLQLPLGGILLTTLRGHLRLHLASLVILRRSKREGFGSSVLEEGSKGIALG